MIKPSATEVMKLIAALSAVIIMGCESAPVEAGTTTTTTDNASSDDTPTNTTTPYTTIAVAPASTSHTSIGNFTVLEISPITDYSYVWSLSDSALGTLSSVTGSKVTYFTTSIPSTGSAIQTITVIGTKTGSTVKYKGTSTITHRAP